MKDKIFGSIKLNRMSSYQFQKISLRILSLIFHLPLSEGQKFSLLAFKFGKFKFSKPLLRSCKNTKKSLQQASHLRLSRIFYTFYYVATSLALQKTTLINFKLSTHLIKKLLLIFTLFKD